MKIVVTFASQVYTSQSYALSFSTPYVDIACSRLQGSYKVQPSDGTNVTRQLYAYTFFSDRYRMYKTQNIECVVGTTSENNPKTLTRKDMTTFFFFETGPVSIAPVFANETIHSSCTCAYIHSR